MKNLFRLGVVTLAFVFTVHGQSYTIRTFAGGGFPQDTPGVSARLGRFQRVAVDPAGNIFMALSDYAVVVRMSTNGLLTLVAGNGTAGFSGDNGPATEAQLNLPIGLAIDSAGSLYIADNANHRIRKVSNGLITTVAGTGVLGFSGDNDLATQAQIGNPVGLAVDSAGNLYIADFPNHRIRRVSNGVITTVAGNGTAGFGGDSGPATNALLNGPNGIAVDSAGNLYIADVNNERIRKVSNGVITTVAGTGSAGFSGDNGPATGAQLSAPGDVAVDSGGNLYVAEVSGYVVRRISNGVITTVAGVGGTGVPAFNGDGLATSARLIGPLGVAVDSARNLYITDSSRVRKVSNGVITTIAGNGQGNGFGDGGPATRAYLPSPSGIAIDFAGNVYISDGWEIRRVANGMVTTVAGDGTIGYTGDGGPATKAQFNSPTGLALDSAGSLYITDYFNNCIRRISGGVISTVAGDGTLGFGNGFAGDNGPATRAKISNPTGVAVDSAGNLYIADRANNRVRKVSGGVITTVAGNGAAGFSGDSGPASGAQLRGPYDVAIDSAGSLYIADSGNHRVRKVSSGVITTVAGNGTAGFSGDNGPATSAQLNGPSNLAIDSDGALYIADSGNQRIRKVSNGIITAIAGNGTAGFSGDSGPATSAQLNAPTGIAIDSAGNLYIADTNNHRVRVLNLRILSPVPCSFGVTPAVVQSVAAGGTLALNLQTDAPCSWTISNLPDWITISGAASGAGPGTVTVVVNANTGPPRTETISIGGVSVTVNQVGAYIIETVAGASSPGFSGDGGPATNARIQTPGAVALDGAGNLYIADTGNQRIRLVSNGVINTIAGTGTAGFSGDGGLATDAQLNGPGGITVDAAGNLYIPESSNNRIRMVSNGVIATIAGNGTPGYSGDQDIATGAQLNSPAGSAVDSSGNLYFADRRNHCVRMVSNGVITTVAGTGVAGFSGDNGPATSARLYDPTGVALDGAGNLYIAEFSGDRVRKVSNGVITTIAGNGTRAFGGDNGPATRAQLNGPIGVAVDSAGNLYIAEYESQRIRLVSNGIITTIAGNGTPGFSGDGGPATSAQLNGPVNLAIDSSGNLYIADWGNSRIRRLVPVTSP
jgi:sugar lactone lactonase YvrE